MSGDEQRADAPANAFLIQGAIAYAGPGAMIGIIVLALGAIVFVSGRVHDKK